MHTFLILLLLHAANVDICDYLHSVLNNILHMQHGLKTDMAHICENQLASHKICILHDECLIFFLIYASTYSTCFLKYLLYVLFLAVMQQTPRQTL